MYKYAKICVCALINREEEEERQNSNEQE
jgi:hypothetical protein